MRIAHNTIYVGFQLFSGNVYDEGVWNLGEKCFLLEKWLHKYDYRELLYIFILVTKRVRIAIRHLIFWENICYCYSFLPICWPFFNDTWKEKNMKNVPTFQKFRALSSYALGNFEVSVNPAQRAANSGQTIKCRELAYDVGIFTVRIL